MTQQESLLPSNARFAIKCAMMAYENLSHEEKLSLLKGICELAPDTEPGQAAERAAHYISKAAEAQLELTAIIDQV